jgi:hypothetical protein
MNTNSKHYEELNIQPWGIMERNFTTEEFVAYLKGNIIKYTLRDKGQALTDAEKIKHYAEKLIEVLESVEEPEVRHKFKVGDRVKVNGFDYHLGDATRKATVRALKVQYSPKDYLVELDAKGKGWKATKEDEGVDVENAWLVPEESLELISEPTYKFNIGNRVLVKGIGEKLKGTIIRLPKEGLRDVDEDNYIIELDAEHAGWPANVIDHEVESDNAWYADDSELELLKEEPKKTLVPNKWYDAEDFTVEELEDLLPVGAKVVVTYYHDNGREVDFEAERLLNTLVKNIGKRSIKNDTRVGITEDCWWRRYFKITEE